MLAPKRKAYFKKLSGQFYHLGLALLHVALCRSEVRWRN